MKQISILGCGWLGLPLAKSLLKKGFSIKGSTTSQEKISVLQDAEIQAFQIALSEEAILGDMDSFMNDSEILIIDIPPKLRGVTKENFVQKIQNLIPFIEASSVQKVIFISSTSVYADDNTVVSESTKPQPDSESGRQLLETEYLLQKQSHFKTTVVRFGGLIGENRHPIHFLAGRASIENPEAPINLIHLSDCICIIEKIIDTNCFGETFHGVAPFHPTRKAYYTQKAVELKLALPQFTEEKPSVGKTILSDKVQTVLKYTFLNTNL